MILRVCSEVKPHYHALHKRSPEPCEQNLHWSEAGALRSLTDRGVGGQIIGPDHGTRYAITGAPPASARGFSFRNYRDEARASQ